MAEARGPIAVYGASGYTGKLVLRELVRRGLPHIVAGRSAARLRAAAAQAGTVAPVRAAAVDDRDALRHLLGDCAAVINCAGPFTRWGEAVVRAAVETGTHYLDTTGEQLFIKRVFDRWDAAARAAEVAVVPAMGFDYAPGDLLSHLVAQGREPLRELVVAYSTQGFDPSRGTARSALEVMGAIGVRYEDGRWEPAPSAPLRASFPFPEPMGRGPVAPYPSGEIVTVPRHVRTRRIVSLIDARDLSPVPGLARILPLTMPLAARALRSPLRPLAHLAVDGLPEGPDEQRRRAARFAVVTIAAGEDGRVARGVLRGTDVYGITATIIAHGASLLAARGFDRAGVLAPAQAFDARAFLDELAAHGTIYDVESA